LIRILQWTLDECDYPTGNEGTISRTREKHPQEESAQRLCPLDLESSGEKEKRRFN
jgi:hypothetical protein